MAKFRWGSHYEGIECSCDIKKNNFQPLSHLILETIQDRYCGTQQETCMRSVKWRHFQ